MDVCVMVCGEIEFVGGVGVWDVFLRVRDDEDVRVLRRMRGRVGGVCFCVYCGVGDGYVCVYGVERFGEGFGGLCV